MKNFIVQHGTDYNEFRICSSDIIDRERDIAYACYLCDLSSIAPTKNTKAYNILNYHHLVFCHLNHNMQAWRRNDEASFILWSEENPRGI